MKSNRLIVWAFVCLVSAVLPHLVFAGDGAVTKNLIVISMDGASRRVVYSLLQKSKLKGFGGIVARGNFRNMEATPSSFNAEVRYQDLIVGNRVSNRNGHFVDDVGQFFPDHRVRLWISNSKTGQTYRAAFDDVPSMNISLISSSLYQTHINEIQTWIGSEQSPFVAFLHWDKALRAGRQFREGGERYSESVIEQDRYLVQLINYLKEENKWKSTEFVISTPLSFYPGSQREDYSKLWIASSWKIKHRGVLEDILPTIYTIMGVPKFKWGRFVKGSVLVEP